MAFVVVMHLDAKQKSLLAELLQRCTKMPVQILTRETRPGPGQVYVAPPGVSVSMDMGALRTSPFEESISHRLPIDAFFRSLALDQGSNHVSKAEAAACQELDGRLSEVSIELQDIAERAISAVEGAHRIRDMIKGMRAFSAVDEELIEPLSFNKVVETALLMTARKINCRARLNKDLGHVPRVSANHGQMCHVFINLLLNAAEAIEEGHADDNEIKVRSWSEDGDVLAQVSDTGCGIPADDLSRVFEPFFTTRPVGSGTGLGLSIALMIVQALGGQLYVETRRARGPASPCASPRLRLNRKRPTTRRSRNAPAADLGPRQPTPNCDRSASRVSAMWRAMAPRACSLVRTKAVVLTVSARVRARCSACCCSSSGGTSSCR